MIDFTVTTIRVMVFLTPSHICAPGDLESDDITLSLDFRKTKKNSSVSLNAASKACARAQQDTLCFRRQMLQKPLGNDKEIIVRPDASWTVRGDGHDSAIAPHSGARLFVGTLVSLRNMGASCFDALKVTPAQPKTKI